MKPLLRYLLFLICLYSFSQNAPQVVLKDSGKLKLSHLNVAVNITGNYATTTYDMKFYNGLNRTLEGELVFPLGEGQTVSRFAMDVNGKLREAVIVEKELARVAYENTVRQNIDPGLLEKTEGNNYKARVYPILPKSYKHLVITYEQELFSSNEKLIYELPLGINETIDQFSLAIDAYTDHLPRMENNAYNKLYFRKKDQTYRANFEEKHSLPNKPIIIEIPNKSGQESVLSHSDYFYINKTLTPNLKLKDKPKDITILWDASYSMRNRKLEEELKLLGNYISYLQNVNINLVSFSNAVHSNTMFKIKNGKWHTLKEHINNITHDGGTAFNSFQNLDVSTDEILLFTDGLSNLGSFSNINKGAIYTINSVVSANHSNLNTIATNSGGNYINLVRLDHQRALELLKQETFQFLGITANKFVSEVYPNKKTNITNNFSLTGRFSQNTTLELLFGYGGKVTQKIPIYIGSAESSKLVKRLWAKQKLKDLNTNKKENKDRIIKHAKQHHLISDYTSMLILDRLEDYVRYRIEPPQELKREYKQRIKELDDIEAERKEEIQERRADLFEEYQDILNWYKTKFPLKSKKVKKITQSAEQSNTNTTQNTQEASPRTQTTIPVNQTRNRTHIDSTKRIVSGQVLDTSGQPLPGTNIYVKGTSRGAQTDFDGYFAINAEVNDELEFSFLGFTPKSVTVGTHSNIRINLEEDASMLEEVVVMGYGVQKKSYVTAAVTTVVTQALAGRVSGVQITTNAGTPGDGSTVSIRGNTSIANNSPLFIVDGVVSETNPLAKLKPEDIESMQTLKDDAATALYGSRASNGLILIVTKDGKDKNQDAIEKLNEEIAEKIELKPWNPDTPYIHILEKEATVESAYNVYLNLRNQYSNSPSFFLDVADFFDQRKSPELAIRIISNLIEVELHNHELMRALAYKLEYFKQHQLATIVYEKVLELRPEEPQSYRDLALAYEYTGSPKKSFDLLYKLYNGDLLEKDEDERFYGIEHVAFTELTRLVSKYQHKLNLSEEQQKEFTDMPLDVRVVIDWNHNDTDIDLWVTDPNGEKAYYSNSETKIGGRMSEDLMEGYGPESFSLKKAIKGNYEVMVDYYSDNVQKISGPTILKVTLFTNYAKPNEQKETIVVRLDKEEDEVEVGNLRFNE
ncbi:VIT domain-containing protein [Seonamhaeicola aphaedonensis]|uniref:TonB-dependent SusC/RagA subfamily outer membrane receptor n=1 Tax=Seonamhaeicola aphaedonensis TaxID=1461338 RepID=A0A3D9HH54_9FLAO|nr:VIT domain-containing protein [Seonamhaeicola aphaedonensis]RED48800.1 TonB-dependent SusC/RagA subfamily outer membrane receptor [Seonamhaeicola aphaedonensis]